jgi:hypothetical protein
MATIKIYELQYLAIINAAAALCPTDRDAFVASVHAELLYEPMIGDGNVGCAIRRAQLLFAHPQIDESRTSRWDRLEPRFERPSKDTVSKRVA